MPTKCHQHSSTDLYKDLWFELNKVFPRKLWTLTANAINHNFDESAHARSAKKVTQSDLIVDPLQVLRCDQRIFRWVNSLKKEPTSTSEIISLVHSSDVARSSRLSCTSSRPSWPRLDLTWRLTCSTIPLWSGCPTHRFVGSLKVRFRSMNMIISCVILGE